jgi:hypothetical protein
MATLRKSCVRMVYFSIQPMNQADHVNCHGEFHVRANFKIQRYILQFYKKNEYNQVCISSSLPDTVPDNMDFSLMALHRSVDYSKIVQKALPHSVNAAKHSLSIQKHWTVIGQI